MVKAEPLEDRETVSVTVNDKSVSTPTESAPKEPEPKVTESKPTTDLGIAAFVDPNQDPQYYVDRYNTEATYKNGLMRIIQSMILFIKQLD